MDAARRRPRRRASSSATTGSSSPTARSPSPTSRRSPASSPARSSTRAPTRAPTSSTGKRVLIIGAGNSGCDIAVDAVHHAASVDMSVRRGYYFVPRYLFGQPSDTLNQGRPLPARIKQFVDTRVLQAFTGDPVRFGFPKPDYKIYESHPIVNTLILNHLGQGDLRMRPDIDRFDGRTVHFRDGRAASTTWSCSRPATRSTTRSSRAKHLNWRGLLAHAVPQRLPAVVQRPVRDGHDRGVRHRLAGPLRAGRAHRRVPLCRAAPSRARRRHSADVSPTSRGPTSPAATTTWASSACRTTSTRTRTAAPCAPRATFLRAEPRPRGPFDRLRAAAQRPAGRPRTKRTPA